MLLLIPKSKACIFVSNMNKIEFPVHLCNDRPVQPVSICVRIVTYCASQKCQWVYLLSKPPESYLTAPLENFVVSLPLKTQKCTSISVVTCHKTRKSLDSHMLQKGLRLGHRGEFYCEFPICS